jgi:hypothetical protein
VWEGGGRKGGRGYTSSFLEKIADRRDPSERALCFTLSVFFGASGVGVREGEGGWDEGVRGEEGGEVLDKRGEEGGEILDSRGEEGGEVLGERGEEGEEQVFGLLLCMSFSPWTAANTSVLITVLASLERKLLFFSFSLSFFSSLCSLTCSFLSCL